MRNKVNYIYFDCRKNEQVTSVLRTSFPCPIPAWTKLMLRVFRSMSTDRRSVACVVLQFVVKHSRNFAPEIVFGNKFVQISSFGNYIYFLFNFIWVLVAAIETLISLWEQHFRSVFNFFFFSSSSDNASSFITLYVTIFVNIHTLSVFFLLAIVQYWLFVAVEILSLTCLIFIVSSAPCQRTRVLERNLAVTNKVLIQNTRILTDLFEVAFDIFRSASELFIDS